MVSWRTCRSDEPDSAAGRHQCVLSISSFVRQPGVYERFLFTDVGRLGRGFEDTASQLKRYPLGGLICLGQAPPCLAVPM